MEISLENLYVDTGAYKGLKTIDDPVLHSRGRGKMTQIQIIKRYKEGL